MQLFEALQHNHICAEQLVVASQMIIRFVILAASQIIIMNQQYDADVSIVNNNAMHVQTLWSFGLINIQSTEQPLQLGGALLCATMETSITAIAAAVGELQEHWNIGTLRAILWWRRILLGFFVPGKL